MTDINQTNSGRDKSSRFVGLVWLLFVAHGLAWIAASPAWTGFDEPFHFGYVEDLYESFRLPILGESELSPKLKQALSDRPLPAHLADAVGGPRFGYDGDMVARESSTTARARVPNHQAQHPPLYYLLCLPLFSLLSSLPFDSLLLVLRIFSLLLASLTVPLSYWVARELFALERDRRFMLLLIASLPVVVIDVARMGNDSLGVPLFTSMILLTLRWRGKEGNRFLAVATGLVLGLGLLTKVYFLTSIPVLFLVGWFLRPGSKRDRALELLACFAAAFGVAGWWYLRNYSLYGAFTGMLEAQTAASAAGGLSGYLAAALHVPWHQMLSNSFRTHVWVGNWSFLKHFLITYLLFAVLYASVGIGLFRRALRVSRHEWREAGGEMVVVAFLSFFVLGEMHHRVLNYIATQGGGGIGGWYVVCLICGEASLMVIGLNALVAERWRTLCHRWVCLAVGAVAFAGIWFVTVPYFSGITRLANETGTVDFSTLRPWSLSYWSALTDRLAHAIPLPMVRSSCCSRRH